MPQRLPRDKYKPNLVISKCNQVTFGAKILKFIGKKSGIPCNTI